MDELIEKITEIYFEKKEKIEELNQELTEIYEERVLINEIIRFVQSCGIQTLEDIDKEIEKYNGKIREVTSYNTNNLKDEKKIALERIKELKKYKEYIEKNNRNNKEINELLNELKTKSIKRTNEQHKQQTQLLPIIRNLIEVCDDKIIELKHENGESVDLSTKFSMLDFVQKRINSFDIYNGILSKKNQHELEQLEEKKKMIIEDIKGIIPDLGAMIRDSIEQEMYDKKRVEASEKLKDNKLKISQLTSIKQNLKGIEKSLLENPFYGLIRKINEQENNIKKIEMKPKDSVIEAEPLKFKGPELSQKLTEQIEKIIQEPVETTKKQEPTPVVTPEELKKMDEIINNIPKEQQMNKETTEEKKTGTVSDEDLQKYLFEEKNNGGEPIVPKLPDGRYADVINKIKQNKLENGQTEQEDEIRIKHKSDIENIKRYLNRQEKKSDEIEKKVKRKTLKQKFIDLSKKVLKKIGDYFIEEEIFEEENAILEQETYNKGINGRAK